MVSRCLGLALASTSRSIRLIHRRNIPSSGGTDALAIHQINCPLLFRATIRKWSADNCLRLGASLSYYTLFSLFPLILVILSIVQLILQDVAAARQVILDALSQVTGGFRDEFLATLTALQQTHRASGILG